MDTAPLRCDAVVISSHDVACGIFNFGNISGANQPLRANHANFNLGHRINIQGAHLLSFSPAFSSLHPAHCLLRPPTRGTERVLVQSHSSRVLHIEKNHCYCENFVGEKNHRYHWTFVEMFFILVVGAWGKPRIRF